MVMVLRPSPLLGVATPAAAVEASDADNENRFVRRRGLDLDQGSAACGDPQVLDLAERLIAMNLL